MIADRATPGAGTLPRLWRARDLLLGLAAAFGAFFVLAFAVAATAGGAGEADPGAAAAAALAFELALGGAVLCLAARRGLTFADLGFVRPRVWGPLAVAWLGAYAILLAWAAAVQALGALGLPVDALEGGNAPEIPRDRAVLVAVLAIAVAAGAPLGEELLFRGLVFRGLRGYWRMLPAMGLSGLLFGVFHANPSVIAPFACIGALYAWAYEESGSLWVTIAAHAGLNGVSFAAALLVLE